VREKREIIELRFYAFVARPLSRLLAALEVNINKFSQYPFPFSELLSSHPSLSLTRPCGTHVMPRSSHYTPQLHRQYSDYNHNKTKGNAEF